MRYMAPLMERIAKGEIDPSFVITHRLRLDDAPNAYEMFRAQARRLHQGGDEALTLSREKGEGRILLLFPCTFFSLIPYPLSLDTRPLVVRPLT